ncbi:MAG: exonuclease SbcCD subunit D [Gemmiger sp.]|nr:exonuclease SbcCD subunit D [Gemmiger sp.]
MKLFHLSDLHLGKRVHGFSMLGDQRDILQKILALADAEHPDALLLAGDIYDKPVPPAEAVALFDDFLAALAARRLQVLAISGNHDSPERIAFGGRLMDASGVHMAPVYAGQLTPVVLQDAEGPVDFYLLPFLKPAQVRAIFPTEPPAATESYTAALATVLRVAAPDFTRRSVLVTHQFVTGAARCASEEVSVGGADNVDAAVFAGFDYVALGHLHGPQRVGRDTLRYCGTPLKYSFSEVGQQKSVTVVELGKKGQVTLRTLPLTPLHDLCERRGSYAALTARSYYADAPWQNDYLHITLTDEEDVPDAIHRLRPIYPNLMALDYDNCRTRAAGALPDLLPTEKPQPMALFAGFFERQNGRPLSEAQQALCQSLIEQIWEGQKCDQPD